MLTGDWASLASNVVIHWSLQTSNAFIEDLLNNHLEMLEQEQAQKDATNLRKTKGES